MSTTRHGWYAVLSLHVCWLLWTGLLKGLGVMLPTLQEQFRSHTWLVGWMVAIISGVINFIGPLAGPLECMFGTRAVVAIGGFLLGVSMIVASSTTSLGQLTLILTLVAAPGLSFANVLTRALVGRCYTSNYATANGIGTSGHAVGMIVMAPLTQLLLDTYGWRGAIMVLGALSLHLGVCGLLICETRDTEKDNNTYQPIRGIYEDLSHKDSTQHSLFHSFKDAILSLSRYFGVSVFLQGSFWIAAVIFVIARLPCDLWLIYFVALAQAKGFPAYDAVTFTSVAGVGSIVISVFLGYVVDRGFVKLRMALLLTIILDSVTLLVIPWMNSYWLMMANAFVCLGAHGTTISFSDVYIREMVGTKHLIHAFSWTELMSAIFTISLGFVPGWIYDQTGSYDLAFVILGCISALPLAALFIEWGLMHWTSSSR
ncbi:monocarboxylate transporter 12-like [Patiria miniata]|uniref:Major facilitator superfamily (MFS) profile domain-containing protein n=1 Tax=Patiria miniata TaxID=46514 RepID=A0A914AC40_PATMI|nr:monocarboxylate transporter 12-like [Patiria miniata]XP_038061036.1 monocarboxylate transporter 12-like [Patiria miniata]